MSQSKKVIQKPHALNEFESNEDVRKLFEEADKENVDVDSIKASLCDYKSAASKSVRAQKTVRKEAEGGIDITGLVTYMNEQKALVQKYEKCIDKLINVIDKQSTMIANYQNLVGLFLTADNESEEK